MSGAPPSIADNQTRTFLRLWATLAPALSTDRDIPERLNQRLKRNRSFGSRDRRLYRELAYTGFRYHAWLTGGLASGGEDAIRALAWLAADIPAARQLKLRWCHDWPAPPDSLEAKRGILRIRARGLNLDASVMPAWLADECPEANHSPLLDTLNTRSPLWIRLQSDDLPAIRSEFYHRGWLATPSPVLDRAWRIDARDADVTQSSAFRSGGFEIQDLGSQIVAAAPPIRKGSRWLDACAGAGGKTLAIARRVGTAGSVTAWDVRTSALEELQTRAERARLRNIEVRRPGSSEAFDGVFIDTPCTGSGTWRRAPHLKHSTTLATIRDAARRQLELLNTLSSHVRPGGTLVYATCSLCRSENSDVTTAFLSANPEFRRLALLESFGYPATPGSGELHIRPDVHDTDGFYLACFVRSQDPGLSCT